MFTIDALSIFVSSIYFKDISKDWEYLFGIPLLIQCFAVVGMLF